MASPNASGKFWLPAGHEVDTQPAAEVVHLVSCEAVVAITTARRPAKTATPEASRSKV